MNIEEIRAFCLALPFATEDVKWENDLCFCIGAKIFCAAGLNSSFDVSFKVKDEEFDLLTTSANIKPAAYVARYKWIAVSDANRFTDKEWEHYIRQSYELVKARLPKSVLAKLG